MKRMTKATRDEAVDYWRNLRRTLAMRLSIAQTRTARARLAAEIEMAEEMIAILVRARTL